MMAMAATRVSTRNREEEFHCSQDDMPHPSDPSLYPSDHVGLLAELGLVKTRE